MAVDTEKFLGRGVGAGGGARLNSDQVHSLKVVNVKLGEVATSLKGSLVLDKMRAELARRKKEKAKRAAKERAKREKKKAKAAAGA